MTSGLEIPIITLEPAEEIEFKDRLGHVTGSSFIIKNKNMQEIYFKVKSTAGKFYSVRPSSGKIHPLGQIKIIIRPHDDSDKALDVIEKKRHKFMVQTAFADPKNPMLQPEIFWRKSEENQSAVNVDKLRSKVVRFQHQTFPENIPQKEQLKEKIETKMDLKNGMKEVELQNIAKDEELRVVKETEPELQDIAKDELQDVKEAELDDVEKEKELEDVEKEKELQVFDMEKELQNIKTQEELQDAGKEKELQEDVKDGDAVKVDELPSGSTMKIESQYTVKEDESQYFTPKKDELHEDMERKVELHEQQKEHPAMSLGLSNSVHSSYHQHPFAMFSSFNHFQRETSNDAYGRYISKVLEGLDRKNAVALKKEIGELIAKYEEYGLV